MHLSENLGGPLAADFVPKAFRAHRLLRLLLPFADAAGATVTWARYAPAGARLPADTAWHALLARAGADPAAFVPADGTLDAATAAALRDLTAGLQMTCLRAWADAPGTVPADPVDIDGVTYARESLTDEHLAEGARVPEFAWDPGARLAWGARTSPDSLVVAADLSRFQAILADPRLTATGVRTEVDALPPSAAR